MVNHCRNCAAETMAALCGECLLKVRAYCDRAQELLPLLQEEVAKTTVKAQGTSGGGATEAVSLTALEAKTDLQRVIRALQIRAGTIATGSPRGLKANAAGLQAMRGAWVDDPLAYLVTEFAQALQRGVRLVDARKEKVTAGLCTCGHVLTKYRDYAGVVVCHRCRHISSIEEARSRLEDKLEEGLDRSYLSSLDCYAGLESRGVPVPLKTIQRWGAEGKVRRRGSSLCFEDVFDLAERRHLRRRVAEKQK